MTELMTEFLAKAPLPDIERTFPEKTPAEIRKMKKRARCRLFQRAYRRRNHSKTSPPCGRDNDFERFAADCVKGSARLLDAIRRVYAV